MKLSYLVCLFLIIYLFSFSDAFRRFKHRKPQYDFDEEFNNDEHVETFRRKRHHSKTGNDFGHYIKKGFDNFAESFQDWMSDFQENMKEEFDEATESFKGLFKEFSKVPAHCHEENFEKEYAKKTKSKQHPSYYHSFSVSHKFCKEENEKEDHNEENLEGEEKSSLIESVDGENTLNCLEGLMAKGELALEEKSSPRSVILTCVGNEKKCITCLNQLKTKVEASAGTLDIKTEEEKENFKVEKEGEQGK